MLFKALRVRRPTDLRIYFTVFSHEKLRTYLSAITCFQSSGVRKPLPFRTKVRLQKISSSRIETQKEETWVKLSIYSMDSKIIDFKLKNNWGCFRCFLSHLCLVNVHSSLFKGQFIWTRSFSLNRCKYLDFQFALLKFWMCAYFHIFLVLEEKSSQWQINLPRQIAKKSSRNPARSSGVNLSRK